MPWNWGVVCVSLVAILAGCGSSGPTESLAVAPTQGVTGDEVSWRGATVTGVRPAAAVPWIEAGWLAAQRQFGSTPDPAGWQIELESPLIACPFYNGTCGGLFIGNERRIRVSWTVPAAKRDGLMAHEFCRYIFYTRTGNARDGRCDTYYAGDAF